MYICTVVQYIVDLIKKENKTPNEIETIS